MKKFLAVIFLMMAASSYADVLPINQFGGLNSDSSPLTLSEGQTPDSENTVTDDGPGIKGRKGFILFSTNPAATGLWEFPLSNGTRYLITRSSNTLKATTSDGLFSVTVGTVPMDRTIATAVLGDKFFYSDSLNGLKYWNGTTVTTSSSSLTFTLLASFKGRLVGSGKSGSERIIYLSKYLDGTNFFLVTNPTDDDPAQITVSGALDESIQALYSTFQDKLIYFKKNAFGGLYGSRRSNFTLRTFSDRIGVASVETIQDCDGKLRWLGNNRKVYEFDGANFVSISDDIDDIFSGVAQGDTSSSFWNQTTSLDFGAGFSSATATIDTTTVSGQVQLYYSTGAILNQCDNSVGGEDLLLDYGGGFPNIYETARSFTPSATFYLNTISFEFISNANSSASIGYRVVANNTGNPFSGTELANTGQSYSNVYTVSTYIERSLSSPIVLSGGTKYWLVVRAFYSTWDLYLNYGTPTCDSSDQYALNNGAVTSTGRYKYKVNGSTYSASGTWQSQVKYAPNLTTFQLFDANYANVDGAHAFYIRSSANSFFIDSSTPNWTALTDNTIPSVTDNPYFQIRDVITTNVSTTTPVFYDFTQNWLEGSNIHSSSGYIDQRYWIGCAISSTSNNRVLVYDKNEQWQRYSGYVPEVMGMYNSRLYVGNTTGVFLTESGFSDNGNAIAAYYKTKTFAPSNLDYYTKLTELRITSDESDNTLEPTFQIDETGTNQSLGSATMDNTVGYQNLKFPFSTSQVQQGKFISLKLSVSGTSFWRVLNGNLYFDRDVIPN